MANISIVNRTKSNKSFYKRAGIGNIKSISNLILILILLVSSLFISIFSIAIKSYISGGILLFFTVCIFPIFYFYIPFSAIMSIYKEKGQGKVSAENYIEYEFNNNSIRVKNADGSRENLRYENIREIDYYKNVIMIVFKDNDPIILNNGEFTKGSLEEFESFLSKKTTAKQRKIK